MTLSSLTLRVAMSQGQTQTDDSNIDAPIWEMLTTSDLKLGVFD
ncbi:MAG: hypothetical protein AAGD07_09285 [Planctomycetota bacterium]